MSTLPIPYTAISRVAILAQIQEFNNDYCSHPQHASLKLEYTFTLADYFRLSIYKSDLANHKASSISLQCLCHELKSDLDSLLAYLTRVDAENFNVQLIFRRCQALAQSIIKLQESVAKEKEKKRLDNLVNENVSAEGKTAQAVENNEAFKMMQRGEMEEERIKKAGQIEEYITQPRKESKAETENEQRKNTEFLEAPQSVRRRSKSPRLESAKPRTSSSNLSLQSVISPMPEYLLDLKAKSKKPPKSLPLILKKERKGKKEDKAIMFTSSTKPGSSSPPVGLELPRSLTNGSKCTHTGSRLEEYHHGSGSSSKLEDWKRIYPETEEEMQRKKRVEAAARRAYEVALANAKDL